jgi:hypothetical protein
LNSFLQFFVFVWAAQLLIVKGWGVVVCGGVSNVQLQIIYIVEVSDRVQTSAEFDTITQWRRFSFEGERNQRNQRTKKQNRFS